MCVFIEETMKLKNPRGNDDPATYGRTHVKAGYDDVMKTEDDPASPRMEIIVVEPRDDLWNESPIIGQFESESNYTRTCDRVSSNRKYYCKDFQVNGSGGLTWNCGQGSSGESTEESTSEALNMKGEEGAAGIMTGSCTGYALPVAKFRIPYIVVAPSMDETQPELVVKNEMSMITDTVNDTGLNDGNGTNMSSPGELKVSPSSTGAHSGNPNGVESIGVAAVCHVDIPRRCRIPVVVPHVMLIHPADSGTTRSYFVTVTYNHAGDIIQLDTRFDRVPEGRYFVVASKPNFPTEIDTAVVHGYLAPATSGASTHAPDRNFAIVDIEYPRESGARATPSESRFGVDRRHHVTCVRCADEERRRSSVRSSRDWRCSRRKRSSGDDKHASRKLSDLKSIHGGAARCADISVFVCSAVQTDRVKYTRVIMRLANELGVAACVHQLLQSVRQARFERHYMDAILDTLVDVGRANESRGINVVYETSAQLSRTCQTPDAGSDRYSTTLTELLRREIENAYFHKKHSFTHVGGACVQQSPGDVA